LKAEQRKLSKQLYNATKNGESADRIALIQDRIKEIQLQRQILVGGQSAGRITEEEKAAARGLTGGGKQANLGEAISELKALRSDVSSRKYTPGK
jgi:hypothetical protein